VCVSVQLPLYICVSPPPLGITCSYSCFGQTLSNNIVLHIHKIQLFMLAGCFFGGRLCVFMEMCVRSSPPVLSKKKNNFHCIWGWCCCYCIGKLERITFYCILWWAGKHGGWANPISHDWKDSPAQSGLKMQ